MQFNVLSLVEQRQSAPFDAAEAPRPAPTDRARDAREVFDRILSGMVLKGHVLEALLLYLRLTAAELLAHVMRLGLPTPSSLRMRKHCGRRPWTPEEVHILIDRWAVNLHVDCIAAEIARSAGAIRSKARRLGLYRRERRNLIRLNVAAAPVAQSTAATSEPPEPPAVVMGDTISPAVAGREDTAQEDHQGLSTSASATKTEAKVGAPAARQRRRIQWTDELDRAVAKRWFAWQCRFGIAEDLGISANAIRTRATRMGLPPRPRKKIVPDYVEGRKYDTSLEDSCVKRWCQQGKMMFYGQRNGPHTSPKVMQTRRYKELRRGMAEATLHL
jgi:hypothetical protein